MAMRIRRSLGIAVIAVVLLVAMATAYVVVRWQDRAAIEELAWDEADSTIVPGEGVTVVWLGVSTLLFDDSETQILIDGYFTRFGLSRFILGDIESDIANVNYAMAEYGMNRLAAIVPVHSHFDHAMDAGVVANRSTAVVLGSESTANIARGARVPVRQYQILADGETRQFGDFTISLIVSRHAPLAGRGKAFFPGSITDPLRQPADIDDWKEGVSYSVLLSHPRGTALIQGSAGFVVDKLKDIHADVVMLGVGGLSRLGEDYTRQYWHEIVTKTGAHTVYPVHYDDFSRPFGEVALFPRILDDASGAANWLNELAASAESPVGIYRLPFGKRVAIY